MKKDKLKKLLATEINKIKKTKLKEAKIKNQDKNDFEISYDIMSGGLTGYVRQDWQDEGVSLELGHYSGGQKGHTFKLEGANLKKFIDSDKKLKDLFTDVKIGEGLPEERKAEYLKAYNAIAIDITQKITMDIKKVVDEYESKLKQVLSKHGFK